jgi:hypothetical protein
MGQIPSQTSYPKRKTVRSSAFLASGIIENMATIPVKVIAVSPNVSAKSVLNTCGKPKRD